MTKVLFELWSKTVFFPAIDQHHRDLGYQGKVVLRIDGFASYHAEQFLAE
jgi:hypothetical protein